VSRVRRPAPAHPTDHPPPEAPHRPGWVPRRPLPGDGPDPGGTPDGPGGSPGGPGGSPDGRGGSPHGPGGSPHGPGVEAPPPARPAWALPAALAAMAVVYPAAFSFRVVPFWSAMVAFSAFSWWAAWHPYLRTRLRPTRRLVAMGLLSGLALYALFLAGALVVQQTPLWPRVQSVVDLTRTTAPGMVGALVIVFATSPSEEVLWRGAVFARLTRRYGAGWRPVVLSAAAYALFVGLSGSPVLPLAALACGTVWARQRQVTGSLVPSLVSHTLWSLLMYLYVPGL
jgi:membrane protease YdiL (CAAX protease family)